MSLLRVTGLTKRFGTNEVLRGIDLEVRQGERIAILGASGSGKSSLLRCLNFMELPTAGVIELDGQPLGRERRSGERVYREGELTRVRQRIGMVFQQFNLFPHMTVLENIVEAPVRVLGVARDKAEEDAISFLSRINMANKADARPENLSGGQQQRVAIARALAMKPQAMLFDEPTASLDPEMVGEVLSVIKDLVNEGMTTIISTHEMGFAREAADRVVVFADGDIIETGPPDEIFSNPKNERTKSFLTRILR